MNITQVIESKYFTNINYLKKIVDTKHAKILSYLPYQKTLHLNRAVILGANGPIKLNIPIIKGRDQRTPFDQVKVAYTENWRKDHWKAIVSSYNRSPWFEHYYDTMAAFYKNDFERLSDWNIESLRIVTSIFKVDTLIEVIETNLNSAQPISFEEHHKDEEKGNGQDAGTYPQVFSDRFGFVPDLSVLDLIFCYGPLLGRNYLKTWQDG